MITKLLKKTEGAAVFVWCRLTNQYQIYTDKCVCSAVQILATPPAHLLCQHHPPGSEVKVMQSQ